MRVMNLVQGSEDWRIWRQGGLGATCAPILMDLCPQKWGQSRRRLWEELTGRRPREVSNVAMTWGNELEPLCRAFYERLTGISMQPACVVHDRHDWLRASLDGLNNEHELILELKCPDKKVHALALDGQIVDYYYCQIQHQFLTSGLRKADYLTHNNKSFKGEDQWAGPLRVERDDAFIRNYFNQARDFWHCVVTDSPPPCTGYYGWYRAGRQRKWRRVTEAGTEQECGRLLDKYADGMAEQHSELFVAACIVDPNEKVRA